MYTHSQCVPNTLTERRMRECMFHGCKQISVASQVFEIYLKYEPKKKLSVRPTILDILI